MVERRRLVTSVLGVLLLVGCESTSPFDFTPVAPRAAGTQAATRAPYNPEGFNLAIVTDVSGSMRKEDPSGFNREGAQLALALSSAEDNLALVAFSNGIKAAIELRSMDDVAGQKAFSEGINSLINRGGTNFIAALEEVDRQLDRVRTTGQTAVIFLSDGVPEDPAKNPRVIEHAIEYGRDQRRIFTIALGPGADKDLLQEMANLSGGNSYQVTRADELVNGYLKILGDFYNLFTYDRDYRQIAVDKSAERLIYVLIKRDLKSIASLQGAIRHDGVAATPSAKAYRREPVEGAAFDVMQFDGDLEGKWTCDLNSRLGDVILLSEVPISFRILPGNPGGEYSEGDSVPYKLEATCGSAEKAAYAAANTTVTVQRWVGDASGRPVSLRAKQQGERVIFSGSERDARQLARGAVESDELQTARFSISLSDAGWTHTKETSLRMLPNEVPPAGAFQVSSGDLSGDILSLGKHWLGAVAYDRSLRLTNSTSDDVRIEFADEGDLIRPPGGIVLKAKQYTSVPVVPTRTQPAAGRYTGRLVITGQYTDPDIEVDVDDTAITLELSVHSVSVGAADQPGVPPGFSGNVTFPVEMGIPGTSMNITGMTPAASTPAGLKVTWPRSFTDSIALSVTVPELTPAGRYEATFRPDVGRGLEPGSEITLGFDVGGSQLAFEATAPGTLTINSDTETDADGWVSFPGGIKVLLRHHAGLEMSAGKGNLVNVDDENLSFSRLDIAMEPSSLTLRNGVQEQLELKMNVGNLPGVGTYQGQVTLRVREAGKVVVTKVLDVEVVVEDS